MKQFVFVLMTLLILNSCKESSGSLMTPSGYSYTHQKTNGTKVKPNDYIYFTLKIVGSDGKILQEMGEGPNIPIIQAPSADKPLPEPNPLVEMLSTASVGDSLFLTMPIDSMPQAKTNPQLAGMDYIKYVACVKDAKDEVAYKAEMEAQRLEMEASKEKSLARLPEIEATVADLLKDYKNNKLKLEKTPEGLEFIILEQTDGVQAENGNRVSVDYYGTLLDGTEFDNSFKRGAPYTFPLGASEVIQGWDIGIAKLRKGEKAALFIPYELAYGESGSGPKIGPKSNLMFYVELADVN